jgi:hypothetical protein
MKVYANGDRQRFGIQTMHINPAAHVSAVDGTASCPKEWFDADGNPLNMTIRFVEGEAEVSDTVGRYMVAHKLARRSRLILPGDALAA